MVLLLPGSGMTNRELIFQVKQSKTKNYHAKNENSLMIRHGHKYFAEFKYNSLNKGISENIVTKTTGIPQVHYSLQKCIER